MHCVLTHLFTLCPGGMYYVHIHVWSKVAGALTYMYIVQQWLFSHYRLSVNVWTYLLVQKRCHQTVPPRPTAREILCFHHFHLASTPW